MEFVEKVSVFLSDWRNVLLIALYVLAGIVIFFLLRKVDEQDNNIRSR